jgi:hypothetical protein
MARPPSWLGAAVQTARSAIALDAQAERHEWSDPSSLCCVMGCTRGPFDSLLWIGSTNHWINPLHAHLVHAGCAPPHQGALGSRRAAATEARQVPVVFGRSGAGMGD